jgi:hypothetical protein
VRRGTRGRFGVVATATACLLSLAVPAAPAADRASAAVADESALASWMFPTERPGHSKWIFAGAYRNAIAGGGTVTVAFAVKGTCRDVRKDGGIVTSCHGMGTGGRIPEGDFRADPALRSGRLVIRERGSRHRLEWRADAEAPPSGYLAGETCQDGTGAGAGFMQHARATGTVFDRDLGPRGVDHAMLSRGAMLTECARAFLGRVARRVAAGQPIRVSLRS